MRHTEILLSGQEIDPTPEEINKLALMAPQQICALCGDALIQGEQRLIGVQYVDTDPNFDDMGMTLKVRIQPAWVCDQCWFYAIDNGERVASLLDGKPDE